MRVACFCGELFEEQGDIVCCPNCGSVVVAVATVPEAERVEMELELERLLDEHDDQQAA